MSRLPGSSVVGPVSRQKELIHFMCEPTVQFFFFFNMLERLFFASGVYFAGHFTLLVSKLVGLEAYCGCGLVLHNSVIIDTPITLSAGHRLP